MPRILVTKYFEARFQPGKPRREFPVGEHLLTQEELDYWFVQRKIDNGCATILPDLGEDLAPGQANQANQVVQADIEDEFLQAMNCPVGAAFPVTTEFVGQKPAPAPAAKPVKAPAAKPTKAQTQAAKPKSASKPAAKPKGKGK